MINHNIICKRDLKKLKKKTLSSLLASNIIYFPIAKYNYLMTMIRYGDAVEEAYQERQRCAI